MVVSSASLGWDATEVLQIANAEHNYKHTCPAITTRKTRCKKTRNPEAYIKARMVLNNMSLCDPARFLREDAELVSLAGQVLCSWHLKPEGQAYAIGEWRKMIQNWIRAQAQVIHPSISPAIVSRAIKEEKVQDRPRDSSLQQDRSVTVDHAKSIKTASQRHPDRQLQTEKQHEASMTEILRKLQELTVRVGALEQEKAVLKRDTTALRRENSRLVRQVAQQSQQISDMEKNQDVLEEQINEQFEEINTYKKRCGE